MNTDKDGLPRFDLALTMAGAISAGAYTAGVIDFLIEAFDAWEDAKHLEDPNAPKHSVSLRVISGASAGAITAAVLGGCLKYQFPHRKLAGQGDGSDNPLYDTWVNMIDISYLLQSRDLENHGKPISVLDSTRLLEIAEKAINYGNGIPVKSRAYISNPLRFIFTTTNLRGVPYELSLKNKNYKHIMIMHGDDLRFTLNWDQTIDAVPTRANEYELSYPQNGSKWSDDSWKRFAIASLASGAFPIGLAPRALERRTSDYSNLEIVVPGGPNQQSRLVPINPCWQENDKPGESYNYVNVDGGTIDNEPLEKARIELAGGDPLARNEREGSKADRATIMIDPFVGPEKSGPSSISDISILSSLLSTFSALKNQARFRPEDLALAMEDNIYSRFLIAPERNDRLTKNASTSIACGSLGGFGGFMHKKFRQHDFYLGRRNCQKFLSETLSLPEDNHLFDNWTKEQKANFAIPVDRSDVKKIIELPIIPLMPALNPKSPKCKIEEEPIWPKGVFDPNTLEDSIDKRLEKLFSALATESENIKKVKKFFFGLGWKIYAKPKLKEFALENITKGLKNHDLL